MLRPGSLIVLNDSKVLNARLLFRKESGAVIEIFCLEPIFSGNQSHKAVWKCLVGGAKKWKEGPLHAEVEAKGQKVELSASKLEVADDGFLIAFEWGPDQPELDFFELLEAFGATPLPPYLNRPAENTDKDDYQTVYARVPGSVAAPTAGLHFTDRLLDELTEKGIGRAQVTLHVGGGTFKPVSAETMQGHVMHQEWMEVDRATVKRLWDAIGKPVIAIGTTSLRTLETLYWIGAKRLTDETFPATGPLHLSQWEPYTLPQDVPAKAALASVLDWLDAANMPSIVAQTQLLIAPSYKLRVATGLLTNFHQPKSTLIMLVASIMGPLWKSAYEHALSKDYRFLSYGDAMLIEPSLVCGEVGP